MAEHWVMKNCPVCGKEFLPAPQHGWMIGTEACPIPVCSYTCQRKWEKNPASKSKSSKKPVKIRIVETGEEFNSGAECVRHLNAKSSTIYDCINKGRAYKGLHIERVVE